MPKSISMQDMKRLEYSTNLNLLGVSSLATEKRLAKLELRESELERIEQATDAIFVDLCENLITDDEHTDRAMLMYDYQAGAISLKELELKFR